MRILIFLVISSFIAGCSSFKAEHHRTLLMDRSTGETKGCEVGMARNEKAYETYEECIRTLEGQGYTIWSQY